MVEGDGGTEHGLAEAGKAIAAKIDQKMDEYANDVRDGKPIQVNRNWVQPIKDKVMAKNMEEYLNNNPAPEKDYAGAKRFTDRIDAILGETGASQAVIQEAIQNVINDASEAGFDTGFIRNHLAKNPDKVTVTEVKK